jgi:hypothetical protein
MRKSYGFRTFHVTEIAFYHALGKRTPSDKAGITGETKMRRLCAGFYRRLQAGYCIHARSSRLPSFSDCTEGIGEHRDFGEHGGKLLD